MGEAQTTEPALDTIGEAPNINSPKCIAPTGAQRTRFREIPKYAEGLYDLNHGLYAWLVPNGSWGESNAGLIVGDGASLLVDTLWDLNYTRAMLDAMRPLTEAAPISTVVNSHADGDHCWGNQLVAGADIITSQASFDEMGRIQPKSMILLGRVGKVLSAARLLGADKVGHWFQNMVAPYDFQAVTFTPPTRTFTGELTLNIGGREVQLIGVGPAHTRGDLMVYVPDAKTLFSADILFIGSTPVMWAGPVENWIAALDWILDLDVDVIVPGHGPLADKSGVSQVKDYWEYVTAQVGQRYAAGMSAKEAAFDILLSDDYARQPFADWNSPERMMTNAFTLYRHQQGRTDHPQVPELMNILRHQALLAHQLPDAQPAVMRK
jgi:glyoxylase-like metal-dependent hydrolase (beta-lactamase superfamily II)